jgi:putative FmdB family regulatory protein
MSKSAIGSWQSEISMPTYDYKCSACGHQFERFQSIKADPIRKCPECGKNKVNRLISTGVGLIFKGSGFYITDYRDSSYKEKAKAESGASGDAASNGKADTKAGGTAGGSESSGKSATPAASTAPAKSESKPAAKSESPKSKK